MEGRSHDDAAALAQRPPCGATTSNNAFRSTDSTALRRLRAGRSSEESCFDSRQKVGLYTFQSVQPGYKTQIKKNKKKKKKKRKKENIKIHTTERRWCELDSVGSEQGIVTKA